MIRESAKRFSLEPRMKLLHIFSEESYNLRTNQSGIQILYETVPPIFQQTLFQQTLLPTPGFTDINDDDRLYVGDFH